MFYNNAVALKAAGLASVEVDQVAEIDGQSTFKFVTKQFDPNTGMEATPRVEIFTPAQLKAQKVGLEARIAEIDALLADVAALKIEVILPSPVEKAIPK